AGCAGTCPSAPAGLLWNRFGGSPGSVYGFAEFGSLPGQSAWLAVFSLARARAAAIQTARTRLVGRLPASGEAGARLSRNGRARTLAALLTVSTALARALLWGSGAGLLPLRRTGTRLTFAVVTFAGFLRGRTCLLAAVLSG